MTARYLVGDVLDVLATLPDASVDLVATSPPTARWRSSSGTRTRDAVWPSEIARRLMLLMCPERVCVECRKPSRRATLGWSDCGHDDWRPGVVLDPFGGAGTTAMVAAQLGRDSISIDLNEEYAAIAAKRIGAYGVVAVRSRDGAVSGPRGQVAML